MLDQIGEKLAGPAGAAFEKAKTQIREATRHAAKEQGLGDRVAGGGEVADMVEREVARGVAQAEAAAAGVESRGDLQFTALPPDRIVVVVAVEAELVEMRGKATDFGVDAFGPRQWPPDPAAKHADLGAQLLRDEFELLD